MATHKDSCLHEPVTLISCTGLGQHLFNFHMEALSEIHIFAEILFENCNKVRKIKKSEGSAFFLNSDPPEAAPLLDPCLEVPKTFAKWLNIERILHF